ncbi:MAG: hypothetical protein AAGF78_13555 [Pseudomonadota bacterium]
MTRMKNAALATLGLILALACLGVFASFGLVVIGVLAALGLMGAVAAGLSSALAKKTDPADA